MNRVALLETIDPIARQSFAAADYKVSVMPASATADELVAFAETHQAMGIRSKPELGSEVFAGTALEAVGCYCIGTEQVKLAAASKHGVAVFNSKYANSRSVVEYATASIINLLRGVGTHNRSMHSGTWSKTEADSHEVKGKTLGIIGYGSIGSQLSVVTEGLGMHVVYYDPDPKVPSYGNATRLPELEDVLAISDVVSLHVPGSDETRGMINVDTLAAMKPKSCLINTARGDVIDYDALKAALESGHLQGAAIDVFKPEPNRYGDPFVHPLRGLDNVILTPHIAGSTVESASGIANDATKKLLAYLTTGNSVGAVNIPAINVGPVPDGLSRILHIHKNRPRVDAIVSGIIGEAGLNVAAKVLQTTANLGYTAIDVEGTVTPDLAAELRAFKHTVRTRIIGNVA